jgi:hypothetical protein
MVCARNWGGVSAEDVKALPYKLGGRANTPHREFTPPGLLGLLPLKPYPVLERNNQ